MKIYAVSGVLVLLSFALGWCGNGYFIYRQIVGSMEWAIQMPLVKK